MAKQVFELNGDEVANILATHFVDNGMMPSGKYNLNLEIKGNKTDRTFSAVLYAEKKQK